MTQIGSFADAAEDEPFPGVRRRAFTTERATVTSYTFEPAAEFPRHQHHQEQITLIQEGEVTFTVDGEAHPLRAGDWAVVGGHAPHGLRAGPGGARILAILVPPRDSRDAFELTDRG